jgi:small multidrug resistance pump
MLQRFCPWLYAAAIYNLLWGCMTIVFPELFFRVVGMAVPTYLALWQVLGMYVLVFAPGYWWAARYPSRHPHLILIGLLGKTFGPIGFAWSAATGLLPSQFGLTILTNDLIWLPSFVLYLAAAAKQRGGWGALLDG